MSEKKPSSATKRKSTLGRRGRLSYTSNPQLETISENAASIANAANAASHDGEVSMYAWQLNNSILNSTVQNNSIASLIDFNTPAKPPAEDTSALPLINFVTPAKSTDASDYLDETLTNSSHDTTIKHVSEPSGDTVHLKIPATSDAEVQVYPAETPPSELRKRITSKEMVVKWLAKDFEELRQFNNDEYLINEQIEAEIINKIDKLEKQLKLSKSKVDYQAEEIEKLEAIVSSSKELLNLKDVQIEELMMVTESLKSKEIKTDEEKTLLIEQRDTLIKKNEELVRELLQLQPTEMPSFKSQIEESNKQISTALEANISSLEAELSQAKSKLAEYEELLPKITERVACIEKENNILCQGISDAFKISHTSSEDLIEELQKLLARFSSVHNEMITLSDTNDLTDFVSLSSPLDTMVTVAHSLLKEKIGIVNYLKNLTDAQLPIGDTVLYLQSLISDKDAYMEHLRNLIASKEELISFWHISQNDVVEDLKEQLKISESRTEDILHFLNTAFFEDNFISFDTLKTHLAEKIKNDDEELSKIKLQWNDSNCVVEQLKKKIISKDELIEVLHGKASEVEEELSKLKQELNDKSSIIEHLKNKIDSKDQLIEQYKEKSSMTREELAKLKKEKNDLNCAIEDLRSKIDSKDQLIEQLQEKLSKAGEELSQLTAEWNDKNCAIEDLKNKIDSKDQLIEQLQEKSPTEEELSKLEEEWNDKNCIIEHLKNQIDSKDQIILQYKEKSSTTREELSKLKEEKNELNCAIEDLRNKIVSKDQLIEQLQEKLLTAGEELSQLTVEWNDKNCVIEHFKNKIDSKDQLIEQLQEKSSDAREELSKLKAERDDLNCVIEDLQNKIVTKDQLIEQCKEKSSTEEELPKLKEEWNCVIEHLKNKIDSKEQLIEQLQDNSLKTRKELSKLSEQRNDMNCAIKDMKAKIDSKDQLIEQLQEKLSATGEELSKFTAEWNDKNCVVEHFKNKIDSKDQLIKQLQEISTDARQELSKLKEERVEMNFAIENLQNKIDSRGQLQEKSAEAEEELSKLKSQLNDSNCMIEHLKNKIDSKEQLIELLQGTATKVEDKLIAFSEIKMHCMLEELTDILTEKDTIPLTFESLKSSLHKEITSSKENISTLEQQLSNLELTLKSKENLISELQKELKKKDIYYESEILGVLCKLNDISVSDDEMPLLFDAILNCANEELRVSHETFEGSILELKTKLQFSYDLIEHLRNQIESKDDLMKYLEEEVFRPEIDNLKDQVLSFESKAEEMLQYFSHVLGTDVLSFDSVKGQINQEMADKHDFAITAKQNMSKLEQQVEDAVSVISHLKNTIDSKCDQIDHLQALRLLPNEEISLLQSQNECIITFLHEILQIKPEERLTFEDLKNNLINEALANEDNIKAAKENVHQLEKKLDVCTSLIEHLRNQITSKDQILFNNLNKSNECVSEVTGLKQQVNTLESEITAAINYFENVATSAQSKSHKEVPLSLSDLKVYIGEEFQRAQMAFLNLEQELSSSNCLLEHLRNKIRSKDDLITHLQETYLGTQVEEMKEKMKRYESEQREILKCFNLAINPDGTLPFETLEERLQGMLSASQVTIDDLKKKILSSESVVENLKNKIKSKDELIKYLQRDMNSSILEEEKTNEVETTSFELESQATEMATNQECSEPNLKNDIEALISLENGEELGESTKSDGLAVNVILSDEKEVSSPVKINELEEKVKLLRVERDTFIKSLSKLVNICDQDLVDFDFLNSHLQKEFNRKENEVTSAGETICILKRKLQISSDLIKHLRNQIESKDQVIRHIHGPSSVEVEKLQQKVSFYQLENQNILDYLNKVLPVGQNGPLPFEALKVRLNEELITSKQNVSLIQEKVLILQEEFINCKSKIEHFKNQLESKDQLIEHLQNELFTMVDLKQKLEASESNTQSMLENLNEILMKDEDIFLPFASLKVLLREEISNARKLPNLMKELEDSNCYIKRIEESLESKNQELEQLQEIKTTFFATHEEIINTNKIKLQTMLDKLNQVLSREGEIMEFDDIIVRLDEVALTLNENVALKDQIEDCNSFIDHLRNKIDSKSQVIKQLQEQISDLEAEKVSMSGYLKNLLEVTSEELLTFEDVKRSLGDLIEKKEQQSVGLQKTVHKLERKLDISSNLIEHLRNQINSLEDQLKAESNSKYSVCNKLEELMAICKEHEFRLNTEVNQFQQEFRDLQLEVSVASETLNAFVNVDTNNSLVDKIQSVVGLLESSRDLNEHLRNVIISKEDQLAQSVKQYNDISLKIMEFCQSLLNDSSLQSADCDDLMDQANDLVVKIMENNVEKQERIEHLMEEGRQFISSQDDLLKLEELLSQKNKIVLEQKDIIKHLESEIMTLSEVLASLKVETVHFEKAVEQFHYDVTGWQNNSTEAFQNYQDSLSVLFDENDILKHELHNKDNLISSQNRTIETLEMEKHNLRCDITKSTTEIKELELVISGKSDSISSLEKNLADLSDDFETFILKSSSLEDTIKALENTISMSNSDCENYKRSVHLLEQEMQVLKDTISQEKCNLSTLSSTKDSLEKENEALKVMLMGESNHCEAQQDILEWLKQAVATASDNLEIRLNEVESRISNSECSFSIDMNISGLENLKHQVSELKSNEFDLNSTIGGICNDLNALTTVSYSVSDVTNILIPKEDSFVSKSSVDNIVSLCGSLEQVNKHLDNLDSEYSTALQNFCSSLVLQEVEDLDKVRDKMAQDAKAFFIQVAAGFGNLDSEIDISLFDFDFSDVPISYNTSSLPNVPFGVICSLLDSIETENKHIFDTFLLGLRIFSNLGLSKPDYNPFQNRNPDYSYMPFPSTGFDEPSRILGHETLNVTNFIETSPEKTMFINFNNVLEVTGAPQMDPFKSVVYDKTFEPVWCSKDAESKLEGPSDISLNDSSQFHDAVGLSEEEIFNATLVDNMEDFCHFVTDLNYFTDVDKNDHSKLIDAVKSELLALKNSVDTGCRFLNENHKDVKSLISKLCQKQSALEKDIARYTVKLVNSEELSQHFLAEVHLLREEKNHLVSSVKKSQAIVNSNMLTLSNTVNNYITQSQVTRNELQDRAVNAEEMFEQAELEITKLKNQLFDLEDMVENEKSSKDDKVMILEDKLTHFQEECSKHLELISTLQTFVKESQVQTSGLEVKLREVENKLFKSQEEIITKQEQINQLEAFLNDARLEITGVKASLSETESFILKSYSGVVTPFTEIKHVDGQIKEKLILLNEKIKIGHEANTSLEELSHLASGRANKLATLLDKEDIPSENDIKGIFAECLSSVYGAPVLAKFDNCLQLLFSWTLKKVSLGMTKTCSNDLPVLADKDPYKTLRESHAALQIDFNELKQKYFKVLDEQSSSIMFSPQEVTLELSKILRLLDLDDNIDTLGGFKAPFMKISSRIELLNELRNHKCANTSNDTNALKQRIRSLENDLREATACRERLLKDIQDLKPDQTNQELVILPLTSLYGTLLSTIMSKESMLVESLSKDYDGKIRSLNDKVCELEGKESKRANWVATVERENCDLLTECDRLKKETSSLKEEIENKVLCEKLLLEELNFLEMKLKQQSDDAAASSRVGDFGSLTSIISLQNPDLQDQPKVSGPLLEKVRQIRKNIIYGEATFVYISDFDGTVKELRKAKDDIEMQYQESQEQIQCLQDQLVEAQNTKTSIEALLSSAFKDFSSLQVNLNTLSENFDKSEAEVKSLTVTVSQLTEELNTARENLMLNEKALAEAQQSAGRAYQELLSEKEVLEIEIESLSSNNRMIVMDNEQLNVKLSEKMKENDSRKMQLVEQTKQLSHRVQLLEGRISSLSDENNCFENQNKKLKAELNEKIKSESSLADRCVQDSQQWQEKLILLEGRAKSLSEENNVLNVENTNLKLKINDRIKELDSLNIKYTEETRLLRENIESNATLCQKLISNSEEYKKQVAALNIKLGENEKDHERQVECYKVKIAECSKQLSSLESLKNSRIVHLENKLQETEIVRLREKTSFEKALAKNSDTTAQLSSRLAAAETEFSREKEQLRKDIDRYLEQIKRLEEALNSGGDKNLQEALAAGVESVLGPLTTAVIELVVHRITVFEDRMEELAEAKERIRQLDEECEEIAQEVSAAKRKFADLARDCVAADNKIAQLEKEKEESMEAAAAEATRVQDRLMTLETQLREEQQTNSAQMENIRMLRQDVSKLSNALNDAELKEAILQKQLESTPHRGCTGCLTLEKQLAQCEALLRERDLRLTQLDKNYSTQSPSQRSTDQYRSKILELKSENERLKREILLQVPDRSSSTLKEQQENRPPSEVDLGGKVLKLEERIDKLTKDRLLLKKICDKRKERIEVLEKLVPASNLKDK